jgi:dihydrofolate reductase
MAPMRRIVMFNWLTADGYFAGPDGNLDWVVPDDEQAKAAVARFSAVDTALFGRRTYELFAEFWPHALDDADATTATDPHRPGLRSREHRAIAVALNEMTKLVFSRSLSAATWKNSRILPELDPGAIAAMKREPGKDMIVFGSGTIVTQLTQAGLIDEYQLVVCPVFIGSGRPLLGDAARAQLQLLEAKQYPSGDVLHRYGRATA